MPQQPTTHRARFSVHVVKERKVKSPSKQLCSTFSEKSFPEMGNMLHPWACYLLRMRWILPREF